MSRAQLRIKVGTVGGADLDGSLEVILNAQNSSWLDTPRDDFEKGTDVLYDLQMDGIRTAADIAGLVVSVPGDDGLCIDELELYLNCFDAHSCPPQNSVFKKVFGPTTCAWSKNSRRPDDPDSAVVNIGFSELRAPTPFGTFPEPFTVRQGLLSIDSMVSIVDAAAAQSFHGAPGNPRFQEGTPTRAVVRDTTTLGLTQTIQADCGKLCLWGTTTAAASFDLVLVSEGELPNVTGTRVETRNVDVHSEIDAWIQYFMPLWQVWETVLEHYISEGIAEQIRNTTGSDLGAPLPGTFFCFAPTRLALCSVP